MANRPERGGQPSSKAVKPTSTAIPSKSRGLLSHGRRPRSARAERLSLRQASAAPIWPATMQVKATLDAWCWMEVSTGPA